MTIIETVLPFTAILSFLSLWITMVILYTPSCFKLRAMIDLIDELGELKTNKIKWSIGYNFHTLDNWLISIPTSNKYLKYELVTRTIERIKAYRTILGVSTTLLIICVLVLLANSK